MQTKICNKCGLEKLLDREHFPVRETGSYRNECKECKNKYTQQYRDTPEIKERLLEEKKIYYIANQEDIIKYKHKFYYDNQDRLLLEADERRNRPGAKLKKQQYNAEYSKKPEIKKKKQENGKTFYQANKEDILNREAKRNKLPEVRAIKNTYAKKRRQEDPAFRLRAYVSATICGELKKNGSSKNNESIIKYLGEIYIRHLIIHLEALFSAPENLTTDGQVWMTMENQGSYRRNEWNDNDPTTWKWQLDHIIPHSMFQYSTMDCQEFRDCWALENLRPLSAKQNVIDGVSRIRHKNGK